MTKLKTMSKPLVTIELAEDMQILFDKYPFSDEGFKEKLAEMNDIDILEVSIRVITSDLFRQRIAGICPDCEEEPEPADMKATRLANKNAYEIMNGKPK